MDHYPGGKGGTGVHQQLINLMPPHDIYIEGYLGSGYIMKAKRPARLNIGVERNPTVLAATAHEIAADPLIISGDACRQASSLMTMGADIARNGDASCGYIFVAADILRLLEVNPLSANTLCYFDPPYLMSVRRSQARIYYEYEYTDADHLALLARIKSLNCMVMLSGYWSEMYADELVGWHTSTFMSMTRGGTMAEEWVWMNYPPSTRLHDYQYLGKNFRQRERIKKKKSRWVKKLQNMDIHERQAIMWAISEAGIE